MRDGSHAVVLIVGLALFHGGAAVAAAPPHLFDGRVLPVGAGPTAVGHADFDGDGIVDLAVLDAAKLSIHPGLGGGAFDRPTRVGAVEHGTRLEIVDLDGDHRFDIVTGGDTVIVFRGRGDGTFDRLAEYPIEDYELHDFTLADVNHDSRVDLVVSVGNQVASHTRLADGSGAFGEPIPFPAAMPLLGFQVDAGDFNEDGHPDVVTGRRVALGNGEGAFSLGPALPGSIEFPWDLLVGDRNGDGHLDLVSVSGWYDRLESLLGVGDGTFVHVQAVPVVEGADHLQWLDFDADGRADVVVSSPIVDSLTLLRSIGGGRFEAPRTVPLPLLGGPTTTGDLDGDGDDDVIVVSTAGEPRSHGPLVSVAMLLPGTGRDTPGFAASRLATDVGPAPGPIAGGDIDGDGLDDFVVARPDAGDVLIATGSGDGTFETVLAEPAGHRPVALALGQLGAGPEPDLVVVDRSFDRFTAWLSTGDGGLEPAGTVGVGQSPEAVVLADFNGDLVLDVATANPLSSDVSVALGLGQGQFAAASGVPVAGLPVALIAEDLNGDGHVDLAVAVTVVGEVAILAGNGDGSFQPETRYPAGGDATSLVAADLDRDGFLDLVVGSGAVAPFDPQLTILWGAAGATLGSPMPLDTVGVVRDLATGDVDGDGRLDLLLGFRDASFVGVLRGVGGRAFESAGEFAVHGGAARLATGDFDANGRLDVLVASGATGVVTTLLNRDPTLIRFLADGVTFGWPELIGADSYNVYRGTLSDFADLDRDGLADGGYGRCVTGLDADPGDTSFTDPSIPESGEGLFYLMARVQAGVELDLGFASSGGTRVPADPCGP